MRPPTLTGCDHSGRSTLGQHLWTPPRRLRSVADCGIVTDPMPRRFYKLDEVAEMLSTSHSQVYALVRRGDLAAIKLGGRGQYRVEQREIDRYVERLYAETKEWIATHPFVESASPTERTGTVEEVPPADADATP